MKGIGYDSGVKKGKYAARIWFFSVLAVGLMFFVTACDAGSFVLLEADGPANVAQTAASTDTLEPAATETSAPADTPEIEGTSEPVSGSIASPESVLQAVFDAAKSGEFAALEGLCDPLGENDGDTQRICDLATEDADRQSFVQVFASGRINGDVQISLDGDEAEVPFLFGPGVGEMKETMRLIKRDGQWYLSSF